MAMEEPPFGFQSTHAARAQSRSFQDYFVACVMGMRELE